MKHRSPTTLREKLIKIDAKVGRHARDATFQMAGVALPRQLPAAIQDRILQLEAPSPLSRPASRVDRTKN